MKKKQEQVMFTPNGAVKLKGAKSPLHRKTVEGL